MFNLGIAYGSLVCRKLRLENMAFELEISVSRSLLSVVSKFYVIKCYKAGRVKVEFTGRSTFPQYLVYSELRNIYPNYTLWILTNLFITD